MNRLDTLGKNLEGMSRDDLLAHVRSIREDRKIARTRTSAKKKATKKKKTEVDKLAEALKKMTPEEIKALLGGGTDEDS